MWCFVELMGNFLRSKRVLPEKKKTKLIIYKRQIYCKAWAYVISLYLMYYGIFHILLIYL